MQIVIDIDDSYYEILKHDVEHGLDFRPCKIIVDGKPLQEAKWQKKRVEETDNIITEWQIAQCSNCKRWHTTPYMYYFYEYKYCPFCGAKMEVTESADSN